MKNLFLLLFSCSLLVGCHCYDEEYKELMEEMWRRDSIVIQRYRTECDRITNAIDEERLGHTSDESICLYHKLISEDDYGSAIPKGYSLYSLSVTGVCPGDQYMLYKQKLNGDINSLGEYYVSQDLKLVPLDFRQTDYFNTYIEIQSLMKGEPIFFVLACKNKDLIAVTEVSVNPIEAVWSDGAKVKITAIDASMEKFQLHIEGLKPNEELSSVSESWDETLTTTDRADEHGSLRKMLSPMVIGHDGGDNKVTITRSETGEKVYLEIPFGTFSTDANSFNVKLQRNSNK